MTAAELPTVGLALFFLLGLRHGAEPDHIAAIDGMTLRAFDRHEDHAGWVGALFALGHGVAVAVIAITVSLAAAAFAVPETLVAASEWLPVLLLIGLGLWNLRALLAPGEYRPDSVRFKLMPRALRERTDLWSSFFVGLLFALVVDTFAHVSAWSVFATSRGGWQAGVVAGLLFSVGMLATSTLDSQVLHRVLRSDADATTTRRYRRGIGWFVVLLSFAVAAHMLADRFEWGSLLDEEAAVWVGVAALALLPVLWVWQRRHSAAKVKREGT